MSAVRKLLSFLRIGVGPIGLLWLPTLFLLRESFSPPTGASVLAAVLGLGVVGQAILYACSNRGFFLGARPPWQLAVSGLGLAAVATLLAAGPPLWLHAATAGSLEVHGAALSFALLQLLALEFGVFTHRVAFREMVEFAEVARARARSAARVLLPVSTFHLDRVLIRLDEVAARAGSEREVGARRELQSLIEELRLRWDDRFARAVPWATAAGLVEAFLAFLARRDDARVRVAPLSRREQLETIPVRSATLCMLAEALSARMPNGAELSVTSVAEDGGLSLSLHATGLEANLEPLPAPLLEELQASLASGARVSRAVDEDGWRIQLWFPPPRPPGPVESLERRLGATELELLEGGPAKPKRVYRRGDDVVKVHLRGAFDPKPTLLEDEFYIMRRLSEAGRWFPEVTGTGRQADYHWLSYRYEAGRPLDAWLADAEGSAQWLRILLDVAQVMQRLRALGVSHRDLNPGNFIVREDGSLVLIDFDQAVADEPHYLGADLDGASSGSAKNDLRSLLERSDLTRRANDAVRILSEHWPDAAPFELDLAGHRFPGREPFAPLWYPILDALGPLAGRRVLDWGSGAPLFGVFAASHQARVTVCPDGDASEALAHALAPLAGSRLEVARGAEVADDYDLAICLPEDGVDAPLPTFPLERVAALVVAWGGDPKQLADRVEPAGLEPTRTLAFTSRLNPLLLFRRPD